MARDLVLIQQFNGTNTCSRCCISMVSNRLLSDVCEVTENGKATWKDLIKALNILKVPCDQEPRKAGRPPIPVARAIVNIKSKQEPKLSHFVVFSADSWYDPFCGFSDKKYHHKWPSHIYPDKYIEIREK